MYRKTSKKQLADKAVSGQLFLTDQIDLANIAKHEHRAPAEVLRELVSEALQARRRKLLDGNGNEEPPPSNSIQQELQTVARLLLMVRGDLENSVKAQAMSWELQQEILGETKATVALTRRVNDILDCESEPGADTLVFDKLHEDAMDAAYNRAEIIQRMASPGVSETQSFEVIPVPLEDDEEGQENGSIDLGSVLYMDEAGVIEEGFLPGHDSP